MQEAACALLIQDGKILLGKRAAHKRICPNQWDLIGGQLDAGETPEQALVREVHEEIGVTVEEYVDFHTMVEDWMECGGPALFHIYRVKRWSGQVTMLGDEHSELGWFTIDEACLLPGLADPDYPELFRKIVED